LYVQQNLSTREVMYTYAKKWDKVLMKEGFWHITINPSKDFLVMANIVSNKFNSIYDDYKNLKGWAYYFTLDWFVKNKNYDRDYNLKELKEYFVSKSLYNDYLQYPEKFIFLS